MCVSESEREREGESEIENESERANKAGQTNLNNLPWMSEI